MKEIRNFSLFLKELFVRIKNRKEIYADKVTREGRLEICKHCEFKKSFLIFKKYGRCSFCGCFNRKKTKYIFEECPKNKW